MIAMVVINDELIQQQQMKKSNVKDIQAGSVVIITGGSSGLGRELALLICRKKVRLLMGGRDANRLKEVRQECLSISDSSVDIFIGDISNEQTCKKLINHAIKLYSRIDYLILNAGLNAHFEFATLKNANVFHQLMKINFYANVYLMKYALSQIKKSKGMVVVISSLSGKFGLPSRTAYCASKFALNGFFQSLRTEQDISLLMVYPTSLETPMRQNSLIKVKSNAKKEEKRQDPKRCAELIIEGMQNQKESIYMPWKGWLGTVLMPLFPNFMRNKLKNAAKL